MRSMHAAARPAVLSLAILLSGCQSLRYDLDAVPVPVSAKAPAAGEPKGEAFTRKEKDVLWFHGLFGRSRADVPAMVTEAAQGAESVASLRVTMAGSFHDWLLTHLSLGLVRMKTVTVEGVAVRRAEAVPQR